MKQPWLKFKKKGGSTTIKHRVRSEDEDDEGFFSDEDAQMPLEGFEVEQDSDSDSDSDSDTEDEELTSDEEVEDNASPPPSMTSFEDLGGGVNLSRNLSLSKSFSDNTKENAIKYGDTIRLYTVSRYTEGIAGGYIGYYLRGGPVVDADGNTSKHRSRGRLLVAVPPVGSQHQHLFVESCFEVVDPTGVHREGDFLRYGDEVALLDDQRMVWNNVQGHFGGLGPKLPGARGEMRLKMRRLNQSKSSTSTPPSSNDKMDDVVHYGDSDVLLDVVTLRRRVKTKKYSQTITNYKKQKNGPNGGYLVSNGRGLGVSFAIHHAQPYCVKLSIRVPDKTSDMPALLAAQDAANRDKDASRNEVQVHHHVNWGVPIPFPANSASMSIQSKTRTNSSGETKVTDKPFISFTLTNGGKGEVTAKQILTSAKNANGFWVDLQVKSSKSKSASKGCVRVTCCRENIGNLTRRLSRLSTGDGIELPDAEDDSPGGPGQVVLRKLNRLRKIPKDLAFGSIRSARIVGGGIVGAGRNIKRGIRADNIKNVPHHIKNAPHHIKQEVGTLFRKVGGGIRGKNKTPTKSARKESNELGSDDDLSDNPPDEPISPKSVLKKAIPPSAHDSQTVSGGLTTPKKSVTLTLDRTKSDGSNSLASLKSNLSDEIELKESKMKKSKSKVLKLVAIGLLLAVFASAFLYTPESSIEVHITALSLKGGDVWWAPLTFKAIFLLEIVYSRLLSLPLQSLGSMLFASDFCTVESLADYRVILSILILLAGLYLVIKRRSSKSGKGLLASSDKGTEHTIWELTLHEWDPRTADELNNLGATSKGGASREKPMMGASLTMADEMSASNEWKDVWGPAQASAFQVRSATYLTSKVKAPSEDALFETIGGDCVISNGPMRHFASRVKLPSTLTELPNHKENAVVPALFVINVQIPMQPKAMFGTQKLPPTVNAVFYLRLRGSTAEALTHIDGPEGGGENSNVTGPVRLLHRWCRDAQTDDVLRGALKLIGFGRNFAELGAPSFVQSYNGKPVLLAGGGLTGSRLGFGQIYRGPNYLEVDIDVASHFTYLSQRGICWALGLCDKLMADIGFVIEGRSEDELPECLLGCVSMNKMPVLSGLDEKAVFGETISSHGSNEEGEEDGKTSQSNEEGGASSTVSRDSCDSNSHEQQMEL